MLGVCGRPVDQYVGASARLARAESIPWRLIDVAKQRRDEHRRHQLLGVLDRPMQMHSIVACIDARAEPGVGDDVVENAGRCVGPSGCEDGIDTITGMGD